jgi:pyruvate dehydrogenase E2 component (dihydrolipoamide acetyltransferase)
MATQVILPALGMAQETGTILRWLKNAGEEVAKGEPLVEIETDKATVEIEAPASGVLANVTGAVGVEIPVGQVIAAILASGESSQEPAVAEVGPAHGETPTDGHATPVTSRFIEGESTTTGLTRLIPASPKARRLAAQQGKDLAAIQGTGPAGAVLVADVLTVGTGVGQGGEGIPVPQTGFLASVRASAPMSSTWRIMAERMTQSWTSAPHFYLIREVNASRLISWREQIQKRSPEKVTYTDLFVKIVAAALREHPRVNASWHAGTIILNDEIHIGLAVAVEQGLVVPVIHRADELSVHDITRLRKDLVARAQVSKLRPQDIQGGTFTISNLGMYGVDAFNAVINPPQAAILAVGRIAERVVPIAGQPSVQPMIVLSLSCDHRVVDGARGAQFLTVLAELIEEPLGLLH